METVRIRPANAALLVAVLVLAGLALVAAPETLGQSGGGPGGPADPGAAAVKKARAALSWGALLDLGNMEARGFWTVVATLVLMIVALATNGFASKAAHVLVYRPYEKAMLNLGRVDLQDLLDYHAQYKWGNYAAITLGMALLSVSMLLSRDFDLPEASKIVQIFAVACMTISSILLFIADLVHTNSQTPIIPVDRRFRLIDLSVQFGTFGALIMVLAVLLFVCMISFYATLVSCIVFLVVLVVARHRRRIPKQEFFEYFNVRDRGEWEAARAGEDSSSDVGFIDERPGPPYSVLEPPYRTVRLGPEEFRKYRRTWFAVRAAGEPVELLENVRRVLGLSPWEKERLDSQMEREWAFVLGLGAAFPSDREAEWRARRKHLALALDLGENQLDGLPPSGKPQTHDPDRNPPPMEGPKPA